MRAGKVLALRVGDVTLDPGREALSVREPKNGSERMVVLGATATPKALRGLRTHLRTLHGAAPSEILFRSTRGTAVSYDALHYQWAGICAATGGSVTEAAVKCKVRRGVRRVLEPVTKREGSGSLTSRSPRDRALAYAVPAQLDVRVAQRAAHVARWLVG